MEIHEKMGYSHEEVLTIILDIFKKLIIILENIYYEGAKKQCRFMNLSVRKERSQKDW